MKQSVEVFTYQLTVSISNDHTFICLVDDKQIINMTKGEIQRCGIKQRIY